MAIGSPAAAFTTAIALTLRFAVSLKLCPPNKFNKGIKNSWEIIAVAGLVPV